MTPRGKKGEKPKMYKAEDFIGTFESLAKGVRKKDIKQSEEQMFNALNLLFPPKDI